jgi:fermentation-respiration switch protein FrsA (DUF1100 family)
VSTRKLLATLGLLAVPPAGLAYAFERTVRRNVFHTGPYVRRAPEAIGVPFEQLRFRTRDNLELEGWWFHQDASPATVLFMHGTSYNASDMWADEERARLFGGFLRGIGCSFFVFDYRGYGDNPGTPTELLTYVDAEAALEHVRERPEVDAERIVLYGFSLGTGIAVELATRHPSRGLVLRAPFTSIRDLVMERYPRLRRWLALAPWLPLTRYNSAGKIGRLQAPLLVMHGDADTTVPHSMGRRLYDLAPEPKTFVSFDGAQHADFPVDVMVPAIRQFVAHVSGDVPSPAGTF